MSYNYQLPEKGFNIDTIGLFRNDDELIIEDNSLPNYPDKKFTFPNGEWLRVKLTEDFWQVNVSHRLVLGANGEIMLDTEYPYRAEMLRKDKYKHNQLFNAD